MNGLKHSCNVHLDVKVLRPLVPKKKRVNRFDERQRRQYGLKLVI